MAPDPIIGQRTFTDGSTRDVSLDQVGRQYVQDDDGQKVLRLVLYLETISENDCHKFLRRWNLRNQIRPQAS